MIQKVSDSMGFIPSFKKEFIQNISDEIVLNIIENLSHLDLLVVSSTCRQWHRLAFSDKFWKNYFLEKQKTFSKILSLKQFIFIDNLLTSGLKKKIGVLTTSDNKIIEKTRVFVA
jgi:hypothetical protein